MILLLMIVSFGECYGRQPIKTRKKEYPEMYNERPRSIMVLPPINKSMKVEAKEVFYSSLVVPLAQKGYYVLPPLLALEILKEESAYDMEMFIDNSMKKVGDLFGTDAVLFTIIHSWKKNKLSGSISICIEYLVKSTKTDIVLFHRKGTYIYQNKESSILVNLLSSALSSSLAEETNVARTCNEYTLDALPVGYLDEKFHLNDSTKKISIIF